MPLMKNVTEARKRFKDFFLESGSIHLEKQSRREEIGTLRLDRFVETMRLT